MEYKETLNMPNTNFEMKGNLKDKDPIFIKEWKKIGIYDKLANRKGKGKFILHDGPPYANGDIHIGHALNKILKDIIIRDNALQGKAIDWRVGWDTHGLPIENKVQQSGIKLSEVGKEVYLKACKNYAISQVFKQQEQFEKLSLLTNFDKKYLTLDSDFETRQIKVFHKMFNKGLIYQDLKPVYWSWSSETALAEAEIEYKNTTDHSIYLKYKHESSDLNFVIWTTTPWTTTANVAIAFGEKISYSIVEVNGDKLVIATELINVVSKIIDKELTIIDSFNPLDYIGQYAINPFNNKKSKLVFGHHVTTEGGTGLVHIAGGHGTDDYIITKKNNLELFVVMDDYGHMINSDELNGMFYLKANKVVIEKTQKNKTLIFHSMLSHPVPIDWRTKEPVIYRATKQWFVSINPIKDEIIKQVKNVNWYPSWGEERLIEMTKNRSDWCISRQRLWGVPIPIIYDSNKQPIKDEKLQSNIEEAFSKEGMLSWDKVKIKDLLPSNIKFEEGMTKETDILDVWFDSGSSHELLNGEQSDIILEGTDQYRGWFNSSLITSLISHGRSPYKAVITHGFVTDDKGNKMSKSIGNTINPMDITSEYGSDILRMWASGTDYQDNIKISNQAIKQVSNDYRKIRNTIRFILGNISDYNGDKPELSLMTKSILNDIRKSFDIVREKYISYNFVQSMKEVMNQLTHGSIQYLLDYYKEVGYIVSTDDIRRRELQYALNESLKYIMYSVGSVIPVTIEEAWKELGNKGLFFETEFPKFELYEVNDFKEFISIKEVVYKEVERLREEKIVKKPNETYIKLSLPLELNSWKDNLKKYLMVAKIEIIDGTLNAKAFKFEGIKCERCWNFFEKEKISEDICLETCKDIIKQLE
ncbi:MAG: isoleucine--tRNA ligase [Mycoplasmataceae bacterium]|nr:isoleucine--tRNA ligase [Mycoplasmataceae bacterium]